jgi:hypothetical protein
MFQSEDEDALFNALQHLKHNKHRVVLFHVIDKETELKFDFDNSPRKFIDIETNEEVVFFAENVKSAYEKKVGDYFKKLALTCAQNKIRYIPVGVGESFDKIMTSYLIEKQNFG